MKTKKRLAIFLIAVLTTVGTVGVRAQMITNDPIHTVVTTLIKFFQEPSFAQLVGNVKKLVQISKFIRGVGRGVELAKDATETLKLINNYGTALAKDRHLLTSEYSMISQDFTAFSKEVAAVTEEMGEVVQSGKGSTMDDGARLAGINRASEKIKSLNSEIRAYVNRISYLSQRRAFSTDDKIATARLYQIASDASTQGGGAIDKLLEFPGYTFSNEYDNEGVDYETERKMAQEAALVQQELYKQYQSMLEMAELKAKSVAAVAIPKMSKEGFFGQKMKEGICPNPPMPQGDQGKHFIQQTVQFDSTSGGTVMLTYEGKGDAEFNRALKQWEYDMEEFCSPLYDIYERQIDMDRTAFMKSELDPKKIELQNWLNQEMEKANKAIQEKYRGQTKTVANEDTEKEYYDQKEQ
ncbi:hypothetical protein SAMN05216327_11828 [Dyadobacter sp. SG02]|uniref:hypothetical protein n=1 Tax=Dyadobacter sp. SG02 TaxID=1855291 RepID=UPI0008C8F992|nr:hypothetical protein [Dyadobacter sp. SG02]SEJ74535.1 hypothetical protein SAMN05216327_11828 [Dyadobacter sp. SG02]